MLGLRITAEIAEGPPSFPVCSVECPGTAPPSRRYRSRSQAVVSSRAQGQHTASHWPLSTRCHHHTSDNIHLTIIHRHAVRLSISKLWHDIGIIILFIGDSEPFFSGVLKFSFQQYLLILFLALSIGTITSNACLLQKYLLHISLFWQANLFVPMGIPKPHGPFRRIAYDHVSSYQRSQSP